MLEVLSALAAVDAVRVVAAPGAAEGYWAGGPSAVAVDDGVWLAYRLRRPVQRGRGYANVVAWSADGIHVTTVSRVTSEQLGCASLERPALVRRPDGGWRMYVSCSTPNSKHWWVEAIDAASPEELARGRRTVVLPGDATQAWKDVVVHVDGNGWRVWACRHPLDGGDDQADRMSTWYGTSDDGLEWTMVAEALRPTPGTWAARGTRVTDISCASGRWWALYDGRRNAAENWSERTGLAVGDAPDALSAVAGPMPEAPGVALRYASVISTADGRRAYFETTAADGSHELRAVNIPRV